MIVYKSSTIVHKIREGIPMNIIFKRMAFTLAEVLITLGIIGVVATITIPTLLSNYSKKVLEGQLKVTYASIQQTMKFMDEEGLSYEVFQDGSDSAMKEWYDSFIAKHMKVESACVNKPGCWHKYGEALDFEGNRNIWDNTNNIGWGINILTFTTAKGAWFDMDGHSSGGCRYFGIDTNDTCLVIYFDANGAKKPNRVGKDIQAVVWTERGLVPAGYDKTKEQIENNCYNGNGYWCLSKIITNDWKIPDKTWKRK